MVSKTRIVVHAFREDLAGVRAARSDVRLSVARDAALGDEAVLVVDYPAASADPAARDVWCETEARDWTVGRALSFYAQSERAIRISLSFPDRNGVAYTAWADLEAGAWQQVRIVFDTIRPNPYFQPPGAQLGAPIDVSEVNAVGFAPHDPSPGRLAIGKLVVSM
ncbi:MAG: hypothetical protein ACOY0T_36035 [Myxococcota bacterium]